MVGVTGDYNTMMNCDDLSNRKMVTDSFNNARNESRWYLCRKKIVFEFFVASFFRSVASFTIEIFSMNFFSNATSKWVFWSPLSEPAKLLSSLIGILSEFSSSWNCWQLIVTSSMTQFEYNSSLYNEIW